MTGNQACVSVVRRAADEGFSHLRICDLTQRLHVSRSTVYRLARDRQSLFEVVIGRILQRAEGRALDAAEKAETTPAAITAYLAATAEPLQAARPAFWRDVEASPGPRSILERHRTISQNGLATLLQDGLSQGAFRPVAPAFVAQVVDAAMRRLQDPAALDGTGMTCTEAVGEFVGILLRGLATDGAGC